MSTEIAFWVAIGSLLVSTVSVFISYRNTKIAKESLNLNQHREEKRRPKFLISLMNNFWKHNRITKCRMYAFSISVSNPTDSDNSISRIELLIKYLMSGNYCCAVKFPHDNSVGDKLIQNANNSFSLPCNIGAHQTAAGSVYFKVDDEILNNNRIDGYRLIITDAHEISSDIEPINVQELSDER